MTGRVAPRVERASGLASVPDPRCLRPGHARVAADAGRVGSAHGLDFAGSAEQYARYVKGHAEATGARLQLAAAIEKAGNAAAAEKELKALYADPKTREMGGRKLADLYERVGRVREASKVRAAVDPAPRKLRDLKRSAR